MTVGFVFDRSDDGLVTLRDMLVEADAPTVLWYLQHEGGVPEPQFARARRRRRSGQPSPVPLAPMADGQLDERLVARVDELTAAVRRTFAPAAYMRFERVAIRDATSVDIDGVTVQSRRLAELLTDCTECMLFATTLGRGVEEHLHMLQDKDDGTSARIVEAIAAAGLLDLTQRVQRRIELIAKKEQLRVTHCQWPGFCDWSEDQTPHLLSRVGGTAEHPVTYAAGTFAPAWSFVGVVGLGTSVSRIKNNPCRRCPSRRTCPRRIW